MNGLQMLLSSLGINIKPEEVESAWMRAKDALPLLAKEFETMRETQNRIEQKLDAILARKENHASQLVDNSVTDIHSSLRDGNHN